MKKKITLLLAFMIVIGAKTFAFNATPIEEDSFLKVIEKNNDIYKIVFTEKGEQEVKLMLKDIKDRALYTEYVQTSNGFTKFLDLSTLPTGHYRFELKSNSNTIFKEIEIVNPNDKYEGLIFIKDLGEEKVFVYSPEKFDSKFQVVVKGANNTTLYKGDIDLSKGQVFNFSKVIGDEVLLTIYEGNKFIKEQTVSLF